MDLSDIKLEITGLDLSSENLNSNRYSDDFLLSTIQADIAIIVGGENLLKMAGEDYIWPLVQSYTDTIILDQKDRFVKYTKPEIARHWYKERIITYMDDPWEIKLLMTTPDAFDIEARFGRKLISKATGISYIAWQREVRHLAKDFIKRVCAVDRRYRDYPGFNEIKRKLIKWAK